MVGANHNRFSYNPSRRWSCDWNCGFCLDANVIPMVERTQSEGWDFAHKYAAGFLIGLIFFVAVPEGARWLNGGAFAQYPAPPSVTNNGPSINTWNQSGGTNTINIGPTKLTFDKPIAEELVSKIPAGKPILLRGIGSDRDQAVVNQYQQFLEEHGFQITRHLIGMVAPPPDHKITLGDPNAAQMVIVIAPSAN
jgi:hypothetical protein